MSAQAGTPYRDGEPRTRPAIWVPGVLFVENAWGSRHATLHTGPEAGRWWARADLRDWKTEVHLVERRAIPEQSARDLGITLPEDLLDAERVPLTRRAAATSPLLAVSPEDADRLLALGVRVYTVGFERRADDVFWVSAVGGGEPKLDVSAPYHDLLGAALGRRDADRDGEEDDALDALRASHFLDRILRAVTGGAVDERRIDQAMAMHGLVTTPVLKRGAWTATRATPEAATRAAQVLEEQLRQIEERAEAQREDAERVAEALAEAAPEQQTITVPVYGEARRHVAPGFTIRKKALTYPYSRIAVPGRSGAVKDRLVVPADPTWQVEAVQPWAPALPMELIQARHAEINAMNRRQQARERRRGCAGLLAVLAVIGLLVALAVWLKPPSCAEVERHVAALVDQRADRHADRPADRAIEWMKSAAAWDGVGAQCRAGYLRPKARRCIVRAATLEDADRCLTHEAPSQIR